MQQTELYNSHKSDYSRVHSRTTTFWTAPLMVHNLTRALLIVTWAFWTTARPLMRSTRLNQTIQESLHLWIAKKRVEYSKRKIYSFKPQYGWTRINPRPTCSLQTKSNSTRKTYKKGSRRKILRSQGAANMSMCNRSEIHLRGTSTIHTRLMTRMCLETSCTTTCLSPVPPGTSLA